jgi:hypothetical protein
MSDRDVPRSRGRILRLLTLLCLSRVREWLHRPGELAVELAGDVSLETAADFSWGLALGGAPGDVGAGPCASAYPGQRDGVDGAVQGPVAAAVEPVPDGLAALAGIGLVPPRAANAASLRHRPGWEKLTMACAALTGPTP